MSDATLPLEGLTVLDLTLARAGPTAVRHLADWGASVIRIEPPLPGPPPSDRDGPDFQNLHRNKRMLQLDLKSADGHALFMRLAAKADVLIENMRSTVKHRLRIAFDDVHAVNPRLVYGSISGFGQTGPYAERPAVDQVAQGMSGLMSITGAPGAGPMRVGIDIADLTAGNTLALGVMMALYERERTGLGRWVHTSLLENLIFMLDFQAARWLMSGQVPCQAGNDHPIHIPTGVFPAADGAITIAAASSRLWPRFCDAVGRPDWAGNTAWATVEGRDEHRDEINAAIAAVTASRPAGHWIELLAEAGVPCGPIYSIDRMFEDPQVRHLDMAAPIDHPRLGASRIVASPLNITGATRTVCFATRDPGADTDAVLADLGCTDQEIADLRARRVVA